MSKANYLSSIECKLDRIDLALKLIDLKQEKIMATNQDILAAAQSLQAAIDTEQAQISAALENLNRAIADLQALVQAGGTAEERQAIVDALTAATADIASTIPDAPAPLVTLISGIVAGNPTTVMCDPTSWNVGDTAGFAEVEGMTELNGVFTTVSAVGVDSLTLDVDSTAFSAYTFGGTLTRV